jgi:hypothetical protein
MMGKSGVVEMGLLEREGIQACVAIGAGRLPLKSPLPRGLREILGLKLTMTHQRLLGLFIILMFVLRVRFDS